MICFSAPIDLAKTFMLKENRKYAALFVGISCFCQTLLQAAALDLVIYFIIGSKDYNENQAYFMIIKWIDIFCTTIGILCIYKNVKAEIKEIR